MIARDLDAGLGTNWVFSTQHYFGPSCVVHLVSGSDLKEHLGKEVKLSLCLTN
jgi:hypothetical protein